MVIYEKVRVWGDICQKKKGCGEMICDVASVNWLESVMQDQHSKDDSVCI